MLNSLDSILIDSKVTQNYLKKNHIDGGKQELVQAIMLESTS